MQKVKPILFFIWPCLVVIGVLRIFQDFSETDRPQGSISLILGLFAILVYYLIDIIKVSILKRNWKGRWIFSLNIVIMSITLFSRYKHYPIWDYPTLIAVPLFIVVSILYVISNRIAKDIKMSVVMGLYLLLIIPLWGFDFNRAPRPYFPVSEFDRFEDVRSREVQLHYEYRYQVTEDLAVKASKLKSDEFYNEAIFLYRQAIDIEPRNPKLRFDLSYCYAKINNLENAVLELDTAISIDKDNPYFYSNRGLMYYKMAKDSLALKDYETTIRLDSNDATVYYNIALVYDDLRLKSLACEAIFKLEKLDSSYSNDPLVKKMKKDNCKNTNTWVIP